MIEAEAGENMRRAGRRCMGVDIDEAGLDIGDAMRIARRLRFREQRGALGVGRQHEIEQAGRAARRFLLDAAEPHLPRHRDRAGIRA